MNIDKKTQKVKTKQDHTSIINHVSNYEKVKSQKDHTLIISHDIKTLILVHCPITMIVTFGTMSKVWRNVYQSEVLWSHLVRRDFEGKTMNGWSAFDEYVYKFRFKYGKVFWQVVDCMNISSNENFTFKEAIDTQICYSFAPETFSFMMLNQMDMEKDKFAAACKASKIDLNITSDDCANWHLFNATKEQRNEFLGTPEICAEHINHFRINKKRLRPRDIEKKIIKLRTKTINFQEKLQELMYK